MSAARSAMNAAATEKQFQTAVLELFAYRGWLTYHVYDARRSTPGFPDCVFSHAVYGVVFAELKRVGGRVSPAQQEWLETLRAGGAAAYLWTPDDWPTIERVAHYGP